MVRGLKLFTERCAQYSGSYVLIGGSACDLLMDEAGLAVRATKDLDIVLCVEVLSPEFVDAFWAFVEEGSYEIRQRGDGKRQFYRFGKPARDDFPSMLELFSRSPDRLDIASDSKLTPIPVEDAVNSLSAILLDDDYYQCIQRGRREIDGVPILGVEYIIPFKVRAWLDLSQRTSAFANNRWARCWLPWSLSMVWSDEVTAVLQELVHIVRKAGSFNANAQVAPQRHCGQTGSRSC